MEGFYGWSVLGGAGWGVRVNLPLSHGAFCAFWGVFCGFSIVGLVCFFWHFSLVLFCDGIYSFLHSIVAFVGDI